MRVAERGGAFAIVEIVDPVDPLLPELEKAFADLLTGMEPHFREFLEGRLDGQGRVKAQLFCGSCQDRAAGLMQMCYRSWRDALVGNVDLLGVLEPYRSTNLGLSLMRHAIAATLSVSARYKLPVAGIVWLTEPDQGPLDSWADRRVRMFERLGGQARRDLRYRYQGQRNPDGELIFWYPLAEAFFDVDTRSLARLLWQFGGLTAEEFARRHGDPEVGEGV
ncbi:hypothetical protein ACFL0G_03960 [Candidatus Zixiibacteriota bacterium]